MNVDNLEKAIKIKGVLDNIEGILGHPELASIAVVGENRYLGEIADGQTYIKGGYVKVEGELQEAVVKVLTEKKNSLLKELGDL